MNKTVLGRGLAMLMAVCTAMSAWALDANHFAQSSRLAQGKWVKVAVSQTGIYQIDHQQLAQMGFSDPARVKVYGYGGKMLSERLTNDLPDDLQQVPILRRRDKICFYAVDDVMLTLRAGADYTIYGRERNNYSLQGYYFLTDADTEPVAEPVVVPYGSATLNTLGTSMDYFFHESELKSLSFTGSQLLGEDITLGNKKFDFQLYNASTDSVWLNTRMGVNIARASTASSSSDVYGRYHCYITTGGSTTEVPHTEAAAYVKGNTRSYTFYEVADGVAVARVAADGRGTLRFQVEETSGNGILRTALLDYFIITYERNNTLQGQPNGQCRMGFGMTTADDVVTVDAADNTVVWDVTNPSLPRTMATVMQNNKVCFTPGDNSDPAQFVAFNPTEQLLQVDSWQPVENQNLHALPVPDMLIITNSTFMPQAERVAQLHRQHDGMTVHVVDQEQVFNEFSSGTPSAMAYRLMCKMFFDRDTTKFKHLLMVGHTSFDNRGIVTGKKNRLMCYETAVSNCDDNSSMIEDFFGFLKDNSGQFMASDSVMIGVGRIPSSSLSEAKSDVDKLYEYVLSKDYGPWRNNYAVMAEKSTTNENNLHERQGAGIAYLIENDLGNTLMVDEAFVGMFPKDITETQKVDEKRTSTEAKRHIYEMFKQGQYFATYVGHANSYRFSNSNMWRTVDVNSCEYSHWPIMTTACCDVARIDGDHQGIAEVMFHKRNGGAIALYTTARQVYANSNDFVNRSFTNALFSTKRYDQMPTLGEVYVKSKQAYGRTSNSNKLNFLLLGDPAIKLNFPLPLLNITKLNTTTLTQSNTVTVRPLQRLNVTAQVMRDDNTSEVNTEFNGDATISIYDCKRKFSTVPGTGEHEEETHDLYYPQELLARVDAKVVNGIVQASIVIPRYERSKGNACTVSVYAHRDGTDQMVSGRTDQLIISTYNGVNVVQDDQAPVIEAMYLNDKEDFAASAQVAGEAMLYIKATDNTAFNLQQQALGQGMTLQLDGGRMSFPMVKNHAQISNEGRALLIAMPLSELTPGRHTLDFAVTDVCGNRTSHSIAFVVNGNNDLTIATTEQASWEQAEVDLTAYTLSQAPAVNLKVTNARGELVWGQTVSSFPYIWDLTDNAGTRVKPGLYKIHGNYQNEEGYGGTNIINFVVLDPLN